MNMLKISIIVAIIGIISIYFITNYLENKIDISQANEHFGEKVTVKGNVGQLFRKNGNTFFRLYDFSGDIKVVAFKKSKIPEAEQLKQGDIVSVTGKVSKYKNELEIIADKIMFF